MRVLHVISGLRKDGGGTSEFVPQLCKALMDAGESVRIVTGRTSCADLADSAINAIKHGVDIRLCSRYNIPGLSFLRVTREFHKELEDAVRWADVVHVHGHWQDPAWHAMRLSIKYRKPYLVQSHGFLNSERLKISKWKKRIISAVLEKRFLNQSAASIATSESERDNLVKFGVNVPIHIVPIGIDTADIDAADVNWSLLENIGLNPQKKTLLFLSRISPIKGLDMLANVWSKVHCKFKDWQLLIAGSDDRGYAATVKEMFRTKSEGNSVVFSGPIYGRNKVKLLRSVNAFVLPTRNENWGIAVQEALAAGLPVICTKGAPWSCLEGGDSWGRCGWWVDASEDGILYGISKCFSCTDEERQSIGREGREYIKRSHTWQSVAEKQIMLYKDCIMRR